MEDSLAKLHAKLDSIGSQLTKIDVIEQTMNTLVVENAALREEVRNKDKIIDELNEKVNRLDQSTRSNSLRIHGLPVTSNTPATEIPYIKEFIIKMEGNTAEFSDISGSEIH